MDALARPAADGVQPVTSRNTRDEDIASSWRFRRIGEIIIRFDATQRTAPSIEAEIAFGRMRQQMQPHAERLHLFGREWRDAGNACGIEPGPAQSGHVTGQRGPAALYRQIVRPFVLIE